MVSPTNEWAQLTGMGIIDRVRPYPQKIFVGDRFTFSCKGWWNLFPISEPLYKELCIEFFSTIIFDENYEDVINRRAFSFRLRGKSISVASRSLESELVFIVMIVN